jgi:hypothetical protein
MFATPPPGIQVRPVLPDGIFSNQKSKFGYILQDPAFGDVGIRYGNFIHFTAKLYILWPFGTFYGHLVYFVVIWYILWSFGIFYSVLVCCTERNLATLGETIVFFI